MSKGSLFIGVAKIIQLKQSNDIPSENILCVPNKTSLSPKICFIMAGLSSCGISPVTQIEFSQTSLLHCLRKSTLSDTTSTL